MAGASRAGIKITVLTGSVGRLLPKAVKVYCTLSLGPLRIPYKIVGRSAACCLHDRRTAAWLRRHAKEIDLVHAWPLASLETIRAARECGIPVVLERINAHIAFAFDIVSEECQLLGVELPAGHDHEYNLRSLQREEREYAEADFLLCPSDFVAQTFLAKGFAEEKLLRHQYGYDEVRFYPQARKKLPQHGISMLYAGVCEPRKGLHYALTAWLKSGAGKTGIFKICGKFVPDYAEQLGPMLSHPSVEVLGHRSDLPELMRHSDIFILPSVEEGSALVTYEARGSGCVLLVSENAGAICSHQREGLLHRIRDVDSLAKQIAQLDQDREILDRLRSSSLETLPAITWTAAGYQLAEVYKRIPFLRDQD